MTNDIHINHENIGYLSDTNIEGNIGLQTLQHNYFHLSKHPYSMTVVLTLIVIATSNVGWLSEMVHLTENACITAHSRGDRL